MEYTTTKKRNLKKFYLDDLLIIQDSDMYAKIFVKLNENEDYYYFYAEQRFEGDFEIERFISANFDDIESTRNLKIECILDDYWERLNLVPACAIAL